MILNRKIPKSAVSKSKQPPHKRIHCGSTSEKGLRRQGLGSQTIRLIEKLANEVGRDRLKVKVRSLERGITQEEIENFYSKNGFVRSIDFPNELVMEEVLWTSV